MTPEEESWGLKSGIWGARSNFWPFSAIWISFLSATASVSFCFVWIRYLYLFKSTDRNNLFSASWHAQIQRLAATPKRSFWAPLNWFLYYLYNLLCTSPGSSKVRMAETVKGFLIKVNRSLIRLKITDPVLDGWFMKFSIYSHCQTSIFRGTWAYWILASKTADNINWGPRIIEVWLYFIKLKVGRTKFWHQKPRITEVWL